MNPTKIILIFLLSTTSWVSNASDKLRVYAASSMTNALNQVVASFEKQYDVDVTMVYGGSASLARQLENGAPGDVFISANVKWMDYLASKNVVLSDSVTNVASNQLVVIAPKGEVYALNISDPLSWLNALGDSRLAIGQTQAVPAGIYAKQSLKHLSVWHQIENQLAPTSNVRIALALVERKESPLGIVYRTDALLSDNVTQVATLPGSSHQPIIYPAARLNDRSQSLLFMEFLASNETRDLFYSFGFQ